METSLHRQLKTQYAVKSQGIEISMHGFRIDAIGKRGELIEIQFASLGALRQKTLRLLAEQTKRVRIVKPIVARKTIVTLDAPEGEILRRRLSPKRGEVLDIFLDLVHFGQVFPHPKLTLEVVLIEAEDIRVDRERPTRRGKRYRNVDQRLVEVLSRIEFVTLADLLKYVPLEDLPSSFDTLELSNALGRPRWFAQKVAYCLRQSGAINIVGKRANSQLYQVHRAGSRIKRNRSA
jgi:hypothetical protein